ncbi:L-fucose kinase [Amphibalanus amphitrite]|uniref:L-fucose kinase n=1 Tax=Amphibalanus amphitrite TaxID=1232801 RepID=A0A6A4WLE3_AMPAM|nr:L-fucose kinase [Amphibalanus amphitrite]KAF0302691.1 L-fucose kinase [Amphibalanus amphitrite]
MGVKLFKWSAVIITCAAQKEATALTQELVMLQQKGHLYADTLCLAVPDPSPELGSGGVTLNALLVAAEHLSAAAGHTALNPDLLRGGSLLMLHMGRRYVYEPGGKGFVTLGCQQDVKGGGVINNNLLHIIHICSELASRSPAGVWVANTDNYLHGRLSELSAVRVPADCHAALVSVAASPEYAQSHGVMDVAEDGTVRQLLYQADVKTLKAMSSQPELHLVAGLVYLSPPVAVSLLSLHVVAPLDGCTYMGVDSGVSSLQMSLYFDMLVAMAANVTEEEFCSGLCGKTYHLSSRLTQATKDRMRVARALVWTELRRYRLRALRLPGFTHTYLTDRLPLADNLIQRYSDEPLHFHCYIAQKDPAQPRLSRTFEKKDGHGQHKYHKHDRRGRHDLQQNEWSDTTVINSKLTYEVKGGDESGGDGSTVMNSNIKCGLLALGKNVYISGIYLQRIKALILQDNLALIGYQDFKIHREDRCVYPPCHGLTYACALFGTGDQLFLPHTDPCATYLNRPWREFFKRKAVTPEDIWSSDLPASRRTLYEARLFPLLSSPDHWTALMVLQDIDLCCGPAHKWFREYRPESWSAVTRYSIRDFVHGVVPVEEYILGRECFWRIVRKHIVENQRPPNGDSFLPYFVAAKGERTPRVEHMLLEALDWAAAAAEPGDAARLLAAQADLLGVMAAGRGGLRSGPAGNAAWQPALHALEHESIGAGVNRLAEVRRDWLGSPDRLIRAARHYERAAQTLVRLSVTESDGPGGWSDTPPICYEMGGLVVDLAITVDGVKPIGARARRTADPATGVRLKLCGPHGDQVLELTSLDSIRDYTSPAAPGQLLKCALIVTNIISLESDTPLAEQLKQTVGGGLEVETWSRLPQGSGMGASSILAAALVSVLWTVSGSGYSKNDVIHATLYLEQVATTGGGWQDIAGGVTGGVIVCSSPGQERHLPFAVGAEWVPVPSSLPDTLARHCLLVFTGRVRLARNLLQTVVRNWYAREPRLVATFRKLVETARQMCAALADGDLEAIGKKMSAYNSQKSELTPSALPEVVQKILAALRPLLLGATIMGAGGGGFLLVLTRQPDQAEAVRAALEALDMPEERLSVHTPALDRHGLEVTVGDAVLPLRQQFTNFASAHTGND